MKKSIIKYLVIFQFKSLLIVLTTYHNIHHLTYRINVLYNFI